jgi:predicted nucleic acid-binding protein
MIDAFIVDASVAIAWVHPAQATSQTALLLQELSEGAQVFAPALWPLEVSNALLVLVRRKKLLEAELRTQIKML